MALRLMEDYLTGISGNFLASEQELKGISKVSTLLQQVANEMRLLRDMYEIIRLNYEELLEVAQEGIPELDSKFNKSYRQPSGKPERIPE